MPHLLLLDNKKVAISSSTEDVSYSARKKRESRVLQREKKEKLNNRTAINQQQYIQNSKHVLKVINTDNNCFMRALMLAIAHINNDTDRFNQKKKKNSIKLSIQK